MRLLTVVLAVLVVASGAAMSATSTGLPACSSLRPVAELFAPLYLASGENHLVVFRVHQAGSERFLGEAYSFVQAPELARGEQWSEQGVELDFHASCEGPLGEVRYVHFGLEASVPVAETAVDLVLVSTDPRARYRLTAAPTGRLMPRILLFGSDGQPKKEFVFLPTDMLGGKAIVSFAWLFGEAPVEGETMKVVYPVTDPISVELIESAERERP